MIKLLAFDIDGTLYDPERFFEYAFNSISLYLARKIGRDAEDIEKKLWNIKKEKSSLHKKLFDDILMHYGIKDKRLVEHLVKLFHSMPLDTIKPYEDVLHVIKELSKEYKLCIVTHGYSHVQSRVLRELELFEYFDFIISAKDEGMTKMNTKLFHKLLKKGFKPDDVVYIADNPLTDFIACRKIGIRTIRVLRGEFSKINVDRSRDAEFCISDFYEMKKILKRLNL